MTEPRQYVLPWPSPVSFGRSDFAVSDANRVAVEAIERWPDWPGRMLAVIGPAGSGKSHLSAVHAEQVRRAGGAVARWPAEAPHLFVEDADTVLGTQAADEALFHTFNRVAGEGGSMLFAARAPLASWPVALPDLRTRLNTVIAVDLAAPDDALLEAVLLKLFADRQIEPDRAYETASWLLPRMERSLGAAAKLVAAIDERALAKRQKLSWRVAADVLSEHGGGEPS